MTYSPLVRKLTPVKWNIEKLGDLSSFISRGKQPKYVVKSSIFVLNQKAIRWGEIQKENLKYNNEGKKISDQFYIKKNDVVINSTGTGTVGRAYYFKDTPSFKMFADSHVTIIRTDESLLNSHFLYYQFSDKRFQNYIENTLLAGSTGQVELNKSKVMEMGILLPEIQTQKKIVEKLKYLDTKIELNNQMIATLEEMASTLFKRWFIDFEFPDENGDPYKFSGGEMIQSEFGEIPKMWQVKKIHEMFIQRKDTFNPNKTPEIQVSHFSMPSFDSLNYAAVENVDSIKSNKTVLSEFSILFSKMNPEIQRVWLPNLHKELLNVCSPEFVVLEAKTPELQSFLYFLCKSKPFQNYLINNATGSTGSRQRVKPSIAISYEIAINEQIIDRFSQYCVNITSLIKNKREEIENLKELRDILLPKLLSGEIELPTDEED